MNNVSPLGPILIPTYNHAFSIEEEYYADIQEVKYKVTTKRAGWDCLRHYEAASNEAVICFRSLKRNRRYMHLTD